MLKIIQAFLFVTILLTSSVVAEIKDQMGRKVQVPAKAVRIIALAPSVTEVIFELEQGHRLVGATMYSNHPEAAKKLPRVGSYVHLDLERILALKPDLCIGTADGNQKHIVERLETLGIPVFLVYPGNMKNIQQATLLIGKAIGAEKEATARVHWMQQKLDAVLKKVSTKTHKPSVFFQVDTPPIIAAGKGTFLDELIQLAGGVNAVSQKSYPRYSWEDVLITKPEVVLMSSMAGGFTHNELKNQWTKWKGIPAVKNDRVYVMDSDLFDRPTPRLVLGLEFLAKTIHPDLFP